MEEGVGGGRGAACVRMLVMETTKVLKTEHRLAGRRTQKMRERHKTISDVSRCKKMSK